MTKRTRERKTADSYLPEDWKEKLISNYAEGASDTEVRAELNITYKLWCKLIDDDPDFFDTVMLGKMYSKAWWLKTGRLNVANHRFNAFLWYKNMQNRFGWSDRSPKPVDEPDDIREAQDDEDVEREISSILNKSGAVKRIQ